MKRFVNLTIAFLLMVSMAKAQKDLKISEVYDFDIGDEYQYVTWEEYIGRSGWREYFRNTVIDKYYTSTGDTLFYKYEVERKYQVFTNYPYGLHYTTATSYDTQRITNLDSVIFNSYRRNGDTSEPGSDYFDTSYVDPNYDNRVVNLIDYWNGFEAGFYVYFIEGFGGWYGDTWSSPSGTSKRLLYFKKGNVEWGERTYIGLDQDENRSTDITIYPNPSNGVIFLKKSGLANLNATITLQDQTGRIIIQNQVSSKDNEEIDLTAFENGVYIVSIHSEENLIYRSKVILIK